MIPGDDFDLDDAIRDATEIGVGALILGLRRVNLSRRELVERVPAAEPVVHAVLEHIEGLAEPASAAVGAIVQAVGEIVPGDAGDRLQDLGITVSSAGPDLLKLSGLTKRD